MSEPVKLVEGNLYQLRYSLVEEVGEGTRTRYYESTMTYLGATRMTYPGMPAGKRELQWNLRPHAGTQTLRLEQIIGVKDLGPTQGREDSRHKPKRRISKPPQAVRSMREVRG